MWLFGVWNFVRGLLCTVGASSSVAAADFQQHLFERACNVCYLRSAIFLCLLRNSHFVPLVGTGFLTPQQRRAAYSVGLRGPARFGFHSENHLNPRAAWIRSGRPFVSQSICEGKNGDAAETKFTFAENVRRPCSTCGKPLMLTRIEPENPGFDLRVYYCAHCGDKETIISAI